MLWINMSLARFELRFSAETEPPSPDDPTHKQCAYEVYEVELSIKSYNGLDIRS